MEKKIFERKISGGVFLKKLLILLGIFCLVAFIALPAQAVEFYGGGFYTAFPGNEELNEHFEELAEGAEEEFEGENFDVAYSLLNSGFGFFIGGKYEVIDNLKVGAEFERFSGSGGVFLSGEFEEEGEEETPQQVVLVELDVGLNYKLTVNGILGTVSYDVTDWLAVSGGVGYYFGKLTGIGEVEMIVDGEEQEELPENMNDLVFSEEYNLKSSFGFKIGALANYNVWDNLDVVGGLNYRILSMEMDEEDLEMEDDTFNLNGIEIRLGVSYSF